MDNFYGTKLKDFLDFYSLKLADKKISSDGLFFEQRVNERSLVGGGKILSLQIERPTGGRFVESKEYLFTHLTAEEWKDIDFFYDCDLANFQLLTDIIYEKNNADIEDRLFPPSGWGI